MNDPGRGPGPGRDRVRDDRPGPEPSPAEPSWPLLGPEVMARIDALAACSEDGGALTRRYLTPQHRDAMERVGQWMRDAGMAVRIDAAANVVGRYPGHDPDAPALVLGSHLDTVVDAGRFDGALGVILPLACVARLHRGGHRLRRPVEVVAFGDEEGARFQSTYLGSRAMAGTLDPCVLDAVDRDGVSVREALRAFGLDPERISDAARDPAGIAAFVEVHIEQGPVLEAEDLPVGVVTAIAGATRLAVTLRGEAGHAGTVPMVLRRDALTAGAEAALLVERRCREPGLVGTVGRFEVAPGAVNVIPGEVRFSVDLRSAENGLRRAAVRDVRAGIAAIAAARGLSHRIECTHEAGSTDCDPRLGERLAEAVAGAGYAVRRLASGAGHDAAAMAALAPAAMLFVRCRGGVSHHPDEHMSEADAEAAGAVLTRFLRAFDAAPARPESRPGAGGGTGVDGGDHPGGPSRAPAARPVEAPG